MPAISRVPPRGMGFTVIPRYASASFANQKAIDVVECGAPVVDTLWLIRAERPLLGVARGR